MTLEEDLAAESPDGLGTLDSKSFYELVKFAAESCLTPENKEQIQSRLRSRQVQTRDLHAILLESDPSDEDWNPLREEAMRYIRNNLHEAPAVIAMSTQVCIWDPPTYETRFEGQDHARTFISVGSWAVEGENYSSEPRSASSKKLAEQIAAYDLLGKVLRIESIVQEESSKSTQFAENHKSRLSERCQQQGLGLPKYTMSKAGPDHKPEFAVVAELTIGGKTYASELSTGPNLTQAEQSAAAGLLKMLPDVHPQPKSAVRVIGGDYISALQTLFGRYQMPRPGFDFQPGEFGFMCRCTAFAPDKTRKTYEGHGNSKKAAKKAAALVAFEDMQPLYQKAKDN